MPLEIILLTILVFPSFEALLSISLFSANNLFAFFELNSVDIIVWRKFKVILPQEKVLVTTPRLREDQVLQTVDFVVEHLDGAGVETEVKLFKSLLIHSAKSL